MPGNRNDSRRICKMTPGRYDQQDQDVENVFFFPQKNPNWPFQQRSGMFEMCIKGEKQGKFIVR